MAVLKCPNCGANNLDNGKGTRCEYCNSFLESKEPEKVEQPSLQTQIKTLVSTGISNLTELPGLNKIFKKDNPSVKEPVDPWTGEPPVKKNGNYRADYIYDGTSGETVDPAADHSPSEKAKTKQRNLIQKILLIPVIILAVLFGALVSLFELGVFDDPDTEDSIRIEAQYTPPAPGYLP